MNSKKERFGKVSKKTAAATAGAALALLIAGGKAAGWRRKAQRSS